jgi:GT2 family glycosyltransferase
VQDETRAPGSFSRKQKLALTANVLQLVDAQSGSTREISFGMYFDSLDLAARAIKIGWILFTLCGLIVYLLGI